MLILRGMVYILGILGLMILEVLEWLISIAISILALIAIYHFIIKRILS